MSLQLLSKFAMNIEHRPRDTLCQLMSGKHHNKHLIQGGHTLSSLFFFWKRNYRVLVRVSLCLCECVFLHNNSKRNRSRNMKFKYIVVYENSSDKFDIEHHRIKVKVTVGLQMFSPFTTIQTVRSYNSTLVQARKLILSMYDHLIAIYKIYEYRHAWMILRISRALKVKK